MTRAHAALFSMVLLGLSCGHALEGAPCACIEGYTCCQAENRCVPGDEFCPADLVCGGQHGPRCGEHGACENRDQGGVCVCSTGYDGPDCAACAEGYVLDASGLCTRRCDLACGTHGACVLSDGVPGCACDEGYAGLDCSACDARYSRQGDACVLVCPSCSAHAYCDVETTQAACQCATGYADSLQDSTSLTCTWQGEGETGGIRDPGFEDARAWDSHLATFAPDAFGTGDQGVFFTGPSACEGGFLAQDIQMPPRALAEPMHIVVDAPLDPPNGRPCFIYQTLKVGESETDLEFPSDVASLRFCLGEAGFGPDVRISLMPYTDRCPSDCVPRMLRGLDIAPAPDGVCPDGPLVNGGFDQSDGWTLVDTEPSVISLQNGALTFLARDSGILVHASQRVHVPLAAETALRVRFENYASNGDPVLVQLDQRDLFSLSAVARGVRTETYCVPREFRGTFRELRFALTGNVGNSQTSVKIDEVSFVQSDACPSDDAGIRDGSFTRVEESPWVLRGDSTRQARVRLSDEGCLAGHCARYGTLANEAGSSRLSQWLRVPDGPGRYRVAWQQRGEPAEALSLTLYARDLIAPAMSYLVNDNAPVTSAWSEQRSACLPARSAGRLMQLELSFGNTVSGTEPALFVDDIRLVPADDCP